jgi:hypothetical protein
MRPERIDYSLVYILSSEILNVSLHTIGTDHPFFPPLEEDTKEWHSVNANYGAIAKAFVGEDRRAQDVLGGNAVRILRLD